MSIAEKTSGQKSGKRLAKVEDLAKFPNENPCPVLRISSEGVILYSNRTSWRLLKQWKTQSRGKVPVRWKKIVTESLKTNKQKTEEIQIGRQTYSFSIVPVAHAGYVNLYGQNITEQKKIEKKLSKERQSLRANIEKRTAELRKTVAALQEEVRHRIKTEKALKRNERKLSEALRIANLGNWEWDINNDTLWWSDEVYRMFGLKAGDFKLSYKAFLEKVHPDDVEKVKSAVQHALNKKKSYNVKHRIFLPDGRVRTIIENAELIQNETVGTVMIGTCQDVTEQEEKQQVLAEHAQLLNLAHDSIIVHDMEGRILFWNAGAEKTYGYSRLEAVGRICYELLGTKFPQHLPKIINHIIKQGSWESELKHKTKDGKDIIVESRWVLRRDRYNNPTGILEIGRDVTNRKLTEQKIEQARIYAESIIDTIQEALVVLDPQLRVRSANNTFYQIFNLKPQQVIQKHLYKIDKGRWDIPELRNLLEEILPKNTSFENYEFDYQKDKTGQMKLRLNARRIYRDAKKTELILLAIRDITLEKQNQQHLRDLTEQLLMAEEKQRQLVATALHDSIGQMLSYSKRELGAVSKSLSQESKKAVDRVRKEINKVISQTRQLTTDLSPPTLHTFGLSAAIEEMLEEFAYENDIAFDFEGNHVHLPISKDFKILLYRSIKELLTNTAKHAKAKKVSIEIGLNNEYGFIIVADDGKGFDVKKLPEQVSKKRKFGLFSIRQRLDNMGGELDIESKKHHGTKIQITVPLDNSTNKKG